MNTLPWRSAAALGALANKVVRNCPEVETAQMWSAVVRKAH